MTIPPPPVLWGEWRCNANPRFYTGWCPGCGGELWMNWTGERWQVVCMEGTCSYEDIQAGVQRLLRAQMKRDAEAAEGAATMQIDDPFHGLPALDYIEALTGQAPDRHFFRCPFHSNSDERTASLHATGPFWYCHGCGKGGTVYDFGAYLWGIQPRGLGFKEIRARLYQALVGVAP